MNTIPKVSPPFKGLSVNFAEISKRVKRLSVSLESLFTQLSKSKPFDVKIKEEYLSSKEHKSQIEIILEMFKSHAQKAPKTLDEDPEMLQKRIDEINKMISNINGYPLENILCQLRKHAMEEEIDDYNITQFLNLVKQSVLNLVVKHSESYELYVFDQLCEQELRNFNVEYYIQNKGLQILNPHKFDAYKQLLFKGINAYYHDFKLYVNEDTDCFKLIDKFFLKLIKKMEILDKQLNENIKIKDQSVYFQEEVGYPKYIFKNEESFLIFKELAIASKTQGDIGFIFRVMSEKENPSLILVKEVAFRNWFNDNFDSLSSNNIMLKNPIKTFDRMGRVNEKMKFFNLIKLKYMKELYAKKSSVISSVKTTIL